MAYPYIIQGDNITIVIGSQTYAVSRSHISFEKLKDAIRSEDWDTVKELVDPQKRVLNYGKGFLSIKGETLYWKDREFHNALSERMFSMMNDGFSIEPLVSFMENLMENPSFRSVNELYGFLERNNLPITPDGHFLAFKKVRDNYTDCHTGKFDNSVGKVVSMERNEVDDDKDRTCSTGLHFCSKEYLSQFGGDRTMIVKINPRDVVSIPTDYGFSKGRACRYEVIAELGVDPEEAFDKPVQDTANQVI